jgi:hypothetical protein
MVSHALRSAKDSNRPRTKKPRKVADHVPTAEEDTQFESSLQQQNIIFQALLQKEWEGNGVTEIMENLFLCGRGMEGKSLPFLNVFSISKLLHAI